MSRSNQASPEAFKPIPLRFGSSTLSRTAFAIRCLVDVQLGTIWDFLAPRLAALRGNILDVGCGEMPYRTFLPKELAYTGIDIPQATAFSMRGSEDVIAFDGVSIPFPDASFDNVLCTEVLEHAARPEALLSEILRVLKPGGTLIATVPFAARVHYAPHDFNRFTKYRLDQMLRSFAEVTIVERGNDLAVIANKLIVLAIRMLRPSIWSIIQWPLELVLVPVAGAFLVIAHLAMAWDLGSKDDPLGYAMIAFKHT